MPKVTLDLTEKSSGYWHLCRNSRDDLISRHRTPEEAMSKGGPIAEAEPESRIFIWHDSEKEIVCKVAATPPSTGTNPSPPAGYEGTGLMFRIWGEVVGDPVDVVVTSEEPELNPSLLHQALASRGITVDMPQAPVPGGGPTIDPVVITTSSLPSVADGGVYSSSIAATGGSGTLTYAAAGLPTGLSINSSTGAITGTHSGATGVHSVTFTVTDSQSPPDVATKILTITVTTAALTITNTVLPSGLQNSAYSAFVQVSGGTGSNTFSVTVGSLPTGLSLNSSTGEISGTPTGSGQQASFTVQVDDTVTTDTQAYVMYFAAAAGGAAVYSMRWDDYATMAAVMAAEPWDLMLTPAPHGEMQLTTAPVPQPNGQTTALYNQFYAQPAGTFFQGQVGSYLYIADRYSNASGVSGSVGGTGASGGLKEFWLEWYQLWDPNFVQGSSTNTLPEGPADPDHKTWFAHEDFWSHNKIYRRWEFKIGPYMDYLDLANNPGGVHMSCGSNNVTAGTDFFWYRYLNNPHPGGPPSRAYDEFIDGQWHQIRVHINSDDVSPEFEWWADGVLRGQGSTDGLASAGTLGSDYTTYGNIKIFRFGANVNTPPPNTAGFWIGSLDLYDSDPGWS